MPDKTKQNVTILLCRPRGFCAGVTRAVQTVEKALKKFGSPLYVRHEIVHNKEVVRQLEEKGAVFVQDLSAVPDGSTIIFSAHGVPLSVKQEAENKHLLCLDATCPLVEKIHYQVRHYVANGYKVILIGHNGHSEVEGTMGQLPNGEIYLVETEKDVDNLPFTTSDKAAFVTQTTLSVDETTKIVQHLKKRFPNIITAKQDDICYATANRQKAVKEVAPLCDVMLVVGSVNSSNSRRLTEVAESNGCKKVFLIDTADKIDWQALSNTRTIGITAGASAPERLILEILARFREEYNLTVKEITAAEEKTTFRLPSLLEER